MKGKSRNQDQINLLQVNLRYMLNPKEPLYQLADSIDWNYFEREFSGYYIDFGRPVKPIRLMVSLLILKHLYSVSDDEVVATWTQNPYWQYFSGMDVFQWKMPCVSSDLTHFRNRIGSEGAEKIFKNSIDVHGQNSDEKEVLIDSTVMEKNITFPTDVKLYRKIIERCRKIAEEESIALRQSYSRIKKKLLLAQRFRHHPHNWKKARSAERQLKTIAGRLLREIERNLSEQSYAQYAEFIGRARHILLQKRSDKQKIYSLHEPDVYCISKGKEHQKYEFGTKGSVVLTKTIGIIVGALNIRNQFDGHSLPVVLEQTERLTQRRPKVAIADRGYRGERKIGATEIVLPKAPNKRSTSYDNVGNIITLNDVIDSKQFSYDNLNRLISMQAVNANDESYIYDDNGNIIDLGSSHYNISGSSNQITSSGFSYDKNGNMTQDRGHQAYYNWRNEIWKFKFDPTYYDYCYYDAFGQRVAQERVYRRYYVTSGMNVLEEYEGLPGSTPSLKVRHIYAGNQRIASVVPGDDIYYVCSDQILSSRVLVDDAGNCDQTRDYYPYGNTSTSTGSVSTYQFSGKEKDATGLYYFGARYYDPAIGRFLTVDPHADKYPSLTPYHYCGNNPLTFVDPTGMDSLQAQQLNEILELTHDSYENKDKSRKCNEATVKALGDYLTKQGIELPKNIFYDKNGSLVSADKIIANIKASDLFKSLTSEQMKNYVSINEGHVIISGKTGKELGDERGHLDLVGMGKTFSTTHNYINPQAIGTSLPALSGNWSEKGRISWSFGKHEPNYYLYVGFTPRPNNVITKK